MTKFKIYFFSSCLLVCFFFGFYIVRSYSDFALNIKYIINTTINSLTKPSVNLSKDPIEIPISLISSKKELNNFKIKNALDKDQLTLSILNSDEYDFLKDLSDINIFKDDNNTLNNIKLNLDDIPLLISKVNANNLDKEFFINIKSISSYGKKNNVPTILYLNSTNSIPKNILKYISSLGINIIITNYNNDLYLEKIHNSLIIYENALDNTDFILQLNLVFFDSKFSSLGSKIITNFTKEDKINQKLEEINEKSINLPFFITESYKFIDIF